MFDKSLKYCLVGLVIMVLVYVIYDEFIKKPQLMIGAILCGPICILFFVYFNEKLYYSHAHVFRKDDEIIPKYIPPIIFCCFLFGGFIFMFSIFIGSLICMFGFGVFVSSLVWIKAFPSSAFGKEIQNLENRYHALEHFLKTESDYIEKLEKQFSIEPRDFSQRVSDTFKNCL